MLVLLKTERHDNLNKLQDTATVSWQVMEEYIWDWILRVQDQGAVQNRNLDKREFINTGALSWDTTFHMRPGSWRWCEHTARTASRSMEKQWATLSMGEIFGFPWQID